ncbi:MAG: orotate phosphoribosyltransferase, partial [Fimbriiglobus sp.]
MSPRDRLQELFRARALQFGDFTLASGKKSTYYVNSKKVLFHAEAITLLGDVLLDATRDLEFQAIGGLEVGAIPMAAAALTAFHRAGRPMEGFFVRKQAKGHGANDKLEGQVNPG